MRPNFLFNTVGNSIMNNCVKRVLSYVSRVLVSSFDVVFF